MAIKVFMAFVLVLQFVFLFPGSLLAGTSFVRIKTSNPATDGWNSGITIEFEADEALCEKAYGKHWYSECDTPDGKAVQGVVEGIRIQPPVPGYWHWTDWGPLRFTPEHMLTPGTRYQISLKDMPLPGRIKLSNSTLTYTTQPQAVLIGKETFWIDPSPQGKHAISLPVRFIWPIADTSAMEQRMKATPADTGSGLTLGSARFIWNEDKTSVVVNIPIVRLPAENTRVQFSVEGFSSFQMNDEGQRLLGKKSQPESTRVLFAVTGTTRLLEIKQISLNKEFDANLDTHYVLNVQTTLRVKPSELAKNLDIVELPLKAEPGAAKPTDWKAIPALRSSDIAQGRPLQPTLLSADEPSDVVRFSVQPGAEHYLMVAVKDALTSTGGLKLSAVRRSVLAVPDMGTGLAFLQPGSVLTLGGEKKLDIYAMGLDRVTWKARRIGDPFLALLAQTKGFTTKDSKDSKDDEDDSEPSVKAEPKLLGDTLEGQLNLNSTTPGRATFPVLDLAPLLTGKENSGHGLFFIELTGHRANKDVEHISRLVLVTNLGLTLKTAADGSSQAFVQDIGKGTPVPGVTVSLLSANGHPALNAVTDSNGMASLPSMNAFVDELKPVAVTALSSKSGGTPDLAWLSLLEPSRKLDMSAFSTSGRHCADDGLIASVFSQRGLYLPGETLHFGAIVRRFDWKPLPENLPLEAVLTTPAAAVAMRKTVTLGADGLVALDWSAPQDTPTGTYTLDLRPVGTQEKGSAILGSTTVRIEEFEPDTLAMKTSLSPALPRGWICTAPGAQPVAAEIRLTTLYGDPARKHRLQSTFQTSPARLHFAGYPDYTFYDATPPVAESSSLPLEDTLTDANGAARLDLPLAGLRGTFHGTLRVEGFEAAGGRSVARQLDALCSPLAQVIGYKPKGAANNLNYLSRNAKASLHILALNNNLDPTALKNVTFTIAHRRYVNTLVTDSRGEYRYESAPLDSNLHEEKLNITDSGLDFVLPTSEAGDFQLSLAGKNGETLAVIPFSVAGQELQAPDKGKEAVSLAKGDLRLALDKTDYAPGETISLRLSAPFDGSGLITVERDSVVASSWFTAKAGENVQKITLPRDFEGRGYVNVSFVRSVESDAIYMSPHVYAAVPFLCGMEKRDMGLSLSVPKTILPGTTMKVRLAARHPGRVLLFAVDEGVLSLTDFATPDPLRELLADRALSVETRQVFDLLMPDHARLRGRIPAFGGGMASPGGRFLNPFRRRQEPPFALWQGIVNVGENGTEIDVTIPEYLAGSVRVMAVGSAKSNSGLLTAGRAQASASVRGSIILRPLLPLASVPGDTFEGAVIVGNTLAGSGKGTKIRVSITPGPALNLVDTPATQEVIVDENSEGVVPFRARVGDILGPCAMTFSAQSTAAKAPVSRTQTLSVRPASTNLRTDSAGPLTDSRSVPVNRTLYPFEARTALSISTAPVSAFLMAEERLGSYPYGCTEQLISRAFPWAASLKNKTLRAQLLRPTAQSSGADLATKGEKSMAAALDAIRRGSVYNGVALWPMDSASDVVTAYAADYLLTLRENGRTVPDDLATPVFSALESIIDRDPVDMADARIKAYACWLLLRNGNIITQKVEQLESWFIENNPAWKKDVSAALLADCYAMLRLSKKARQLMPETLTDALHGEGQSGMFSDTAAQALFASIASGSFWEKGSGALTEGLVERMFRSTATTFELGLGSRALSALSGGTPSPKGIGLSCQQYAADFEPTNQQAVADDSQIVLNAPGCLRFAATLPADQTGKGWTWHLTAEGFDRHAATTALTNGMFLARRYLNAKGEEVSSARTGDVLTIELTARSERKTDNVVITDLLPGGLEPILDKSGQPVGTSGLVRWERREDRGLFFVSLDTTPRVFSYRVRAVTAGNFLVPPASAEAMYRPEVNARTGSGSTLNIRKTQAQN